MLNLGLWGSHILLSTPPLHVDPFVYDSVGWFVYDGVPGYIEAWQVEMNGVTYSFRQAYFMYYCVTQDETAYSILAPYAETGEPVPGEVLGCEEGERVSLQYYGSPLRRVTLPSKFVEHLAFPVVDESVVVCGGEVPLSELGVVWDYVDPYSSYPSWTREVSVEVVGCGAGAGLVRELEQMVQVEGVSERVLEKLYDFVIAQCNVTNVTIRVVEMNEEVLGVGLLDCLRAPKYSLLAPGKYKKVYVVERTVVEAMFDGAGAVRNVTTEYLVRTALPWPQEGEYYIFVFYKKTPVSDDVYVAAVKAYFPGACDC